MSFSPHFQDLAFKERQDILRGAIERSSSQEVQNKLTLELFSLTKEEALKPHLAKLERAAPQEETKSSCCCTAFFKAFFS